MFKGICIYFVIIAVFFSILVIPVQSDSPYSRWVNGPPTDANFFMIGVWLQQSRFSDQYKAMNINTYVALDPGSAGYAASISQLKGNGFYFILSAQDDEAWNYTSERNFISWLLPDEPDNCQFKSITIKGRRFPTSGDFPTNCSGAGRIPPEELMNMYNWIRQNDASRPVHVGLGQGVANDNYVGRGSGFSQSMYVDYCKASDIPGFDIYPYVGMGSPLTSSIDLLWYQAKGLDSLVTWSNDKPLWNTIECTHIGNTTNLPTPQTCKLEVWMSIIHKARGFIWFVHEWYPSFSMTGVFRYPELVDAITKINAQVLSLAPVINSPSLTGRVSVTSSAGSVVPIDIMVKEYNNKLYIFSCGMRNGATTGVFTVYGGGDGVVNVLGGRKE